MQHSAGPERACGVLHYIRLGCEGLILGHYLLLYWISQTPLTDILLQNRDGRLISQHQARNRLFYCGRRFYGLDPATVEQSQGTAVHQWNGQWEICVPFWMTGLSPRQKAAGTGDDFERGNLFMMGFFLREMIESLLHEDNPPWCYSGGFFCPNFLYRYQFSSSCRTLHDETLALRLAIRFQPADKARQRTSLDTQQFRQARQSNWLACLVLS